MTLRFPALALVLAIAGACARDDVRAPVTPPPPTESAPAEPVAIEPGTPPVVPTPQAVPPAAVVTIVEVDVQAGPLASQLAAVAARAEHEHRVIAVELWAGWCAPCKAFDRMLDAGTVTDALAGSILVRVDVDMFDDELNALGFTAPQIPSLYRVDRKGKPRGKPLQGGAWHKLETTQVAAALRTFLSG